MSFCYLSYFRKSPILCVLILVPIFVMSDSLSNSYLQFCFIASFAFVLQMLRAKPIPLKLYERFNRLPPGGSCQQS